MAAVRNQIEKEILEIIYRENRFLDELCLPVNYQALHIRRGDYVQNPNHYGLLKLDYYKKLIISNMETIICTDDAHFELEISKHFPNFRIIGPSKSTSWETFSLLARAKRLIMANSSLSWWAGLIVSGNNGEAIAPSPWFQSSIFPTTLLRNETFTQIAAEFE